MRRVCLLALMFVAWLCASLDGFAQTPPSCPPAACLPEALMSAMAPEMLATTLIVMAARADGLDPAYAIDLVIAGLAHGGHKPVASLETPERQLEVLLGRNREEAQAIVEQTL